MWVPLPVAGVRLSLWRAVAVFRIVTLALCLYLIVRWQPLYRHPSAALATGGAMLAWTALVAWLALAGRAHRIAFVAVDALVTAGLTYVTIGAQTAGQLHGGMPTLTTTWAAGPVIEAAFVAGPVGGVLAGLFQLAAAMVVRQGYDGRTLNSAVLLLLTGVVVGLLARSTVRAEADLRAAAAAQAALEERERLARSIHDGVLQVLGLVHRTGRDAGGEWERLAHAAAEQEAALRGLITSAPSAGSPGSRDLGAALRGLRSTSITVSTPADPVLLDASTVDEITAAVRAALDNVAVHAGAGTRAWILLESLDDAIEVTVRDDGVGMANGRLDAAAREGRLGVARSVRGRIDDLGGRCTITSAPGRGTEISMTIPTGASR
ncbi:MAG TPA: DUF5931 domain-containing protein [Jatrophihabitans sp.]|jgi:signal transduction histidine kinase|uniref:MacS family sensor histidine kinase n=1 Tax=Jatrophihabitans sp. TaxID=1932789 RepID=UPI002E080DB9|nr:DUF5931 domain-containing protein [Jatrophihabitans sp.]